MFGSGKLKYEEGANKLKLEGKVKLSAAMSAGKKKKKSTGYFYPRNVIL